MNQGRVSTERKLQTILDVLTARAAYEPARVALSVVGGESLRFGEWERSSNAVARGLREAGVRKGDAVALFFDDRDWIAYATAYIGAYKAGAVTVHMNPRYSAGELARRIVQCGISIVVHSPRLRPPNHPHVVSVDALRHSDDGPLDVGLSPEDVADVAYTAGTTRGVSKGVIVQHGDYLLGVELDEVIGVESDRSFLGPFPAGTPSSQNILLMGMALPPSLLLLPEPSSRATWDAIESLKITNVMLTPGMAIDLVNLPRARSGVLESVRSLSVGAAAIPPTVLGRVLALFPNASVTQYYLSLESIPAITASSYDPKHPWSVGKPLMGTEIQIRDEGGSLLGPGEVGNVWMRPKGRVRAYQGDPEWNARTFHDEWLSMGDMGSLDEEGCLHFFDRAEDAIRGQRGPTSTLVVEDALFHHPAVRDACVVGVPGPDGEPRVAAALVVDPGTSLDDVLTVCGEQVDAHDVPTDVRVVEYLPRGLIGKTLKREIRRWFDPETGDDALVAHRERRDHYW